MEKRTGLAIIAKAGLRVDLDSIKQVLEILRPIATPDHHVQIPVKQRKISLQTPSGRGNQEVASEIGGSTIQSNPPVSDKTTREFKRAAYRTKLHLHPQLPPMSPNLECA
ncbi:hypothetical protein [uncultured Ruegeria sp.]|uniref:hypothetical protein n=1 Tax=uncultured Ruegeria sp. TaxID=259304 RepID=UPI00261D6DAA|nr:hypothetical protein [uncultured Ruegeria sp.]